MRIMIIIILFTFSACNSNKPVIIHSNIEMVLIDSSAATQNLCPYIPNERRYGYYPVYFIGELMDTFRIGSRKILGYGNNPDYDKARNFAEPDSTKMKIFIDTAFVVTHTIYFQSNFNGEDEEVVDSTISYKALPIFVYNLCDSLLSVGSFSELGYIVRQAKNEAGLWVDIESRISYFCGTGARDIVIEPNQVLIAKLLLYKGGFKTECRLKFTRFRKAVYSNTFTGYINKRQLTDPLKRY